MVSKPIWSAKYRRDVDTFELAKVLASSRSKVFIGIDLEWDETDPDTILEIGIAVLDLRQGRLRPNSFPPSTWSIRPRHFIIRENAHIHNGKYVRSNKFGFKFGSSYFASLSTAVKKVQSIFDSYAPNDVMMVGHNMAKDLDKLESLGLALPDVFDTANIERAFSRRVNGSKRKLERICEDLDIPYYRQDKMHNAGNDAFFTMAIFSEMCCTADSQ
jgi:hypothetical protein